MDDCQRLAGQWHQLTDQSAVQQTPKLCTCILIIGKTRLDRLAAAAELASDPRKNIAAQLFRSLRIVAVDILSK